MNNHADKNFHTRYQSLVFQCKSSILRAKRGFENIFDARIKRHLPAENLKDSPMIAESKTPLWTESAPQEQFLLVGKIHNLRLAVKKLNCLEIPAGEVFSFWKHLGRANQLRGYVVGRELREGCIIPNIGGGLCQLSNALYDAALQADFEIVERHAHSQIVAGSLAEQGRDATVFWNYVDLRFRSPTAFRIEAFLGKDHLTVQFKGEKTYSKPNQISPASAIKNGNSKNNIKHPQSCATCGVESCFRSLKIETTPEFGKTAFLVDEFSPEIDEYIQQNRTEKDVLFVPLDGLRFKKANYSWTNKGFAQTEQSIFVTLQRSYKSRRLAVQGAKRQKNLLRMYEKLVKSYAKKLNYDATHLVVQQNLLPFLWCEGVLGGRTFDVLMTSLPLTELQKRLDFAALLYPESTTLGDFRAESYLLEAETEALISARKIITPHTDIAALFPNRAELLNWQMPKARVFEKIKNDKFTVVFPASTVGRKGCYELREVLRDLDVKLITLGAELEGANFWEGIDWETGNKNRLEKADLVVLPAHVEHKPRRLLQAAANNIPVIASTACGLENVAGVVSVKTDDTESLRRCVINLMVKKESELAFVEKIRFAC